METDAERYVLALQAALRVKGYTPAHPTMKKVLRLKRSMGRNKTRRYTFNLMQAKVETPTLQNKPVVTNDRSELLSPILERVTGLRFHTKEAKLASSGHFIVKFVLVGRSEEARIEPGTNSPVGPLKAREAVASAVLAELGTELSSFSVQPFRIKMDKGRIGLSVQCIYRGRDAAQIKEA
jgi:hypothetical protein